MCVPVYMYAHVYGGAHGDHRHWIPRDEVPCSYDPPIRAQVTELGSSAKKQYTLVNNELPLPHKNNIF